MIDYSPRLQVLPGGKTQTLDMQRQVLAGLTATPKSIPTKFFFDRAGRELFDRRAQLESNYLVRCEQTILRENARDIAGLFPPGFRFVDIGASKHSELILNHVETDGSYFPVDTSFPELQTLAQQLVAKYPALRVAPVAAEVDEPFVLPWSGLGRTISFLSAAGIGAFEPVEAGKMLRRLARVSGHGGGVLLGVDLKKDPLVLHRAYNDEEGVTAAFNLNLLFRLNEELGADFDAGGYSHYAFFEPTKGCVEMHLVSRERQAIHLGGRTVIMQQGESIRTERAYKYTPDEFSAMARAAGLTLVQCWTDARDYYAVMYFEVAANN